MPNDIKILLKWRNSEDYIYFCTKNKYILSSEKELIEELKHDFMCDRFDQVISFTREGDPIGTLFLYDCSIIHGTGFFTAYIDKHYRRSYFSVLSILKYLINAFKYYGFYKIYMDIYEKNFYIINMLNKRNIPLEGRFKGHRIFKGERVDVLRYALYSDWLE